MLVDGLVEEGLEGPAERVEFAVVVQQEHREGVLAGHVHAGHGPVVQAWAKEERLEPGYNI